LGIRFPGFIQAENLVKPRSSRRAIRRSVTDSGEPKIAWSRSTSSKVGVASRSALASRASLVQAVASLFSSAQPIER